MRGLVLIEQQFHNATPEQQDYYKHTGTGPEKHKLAVSQPCKGQISLHYFSCDSHCFLLQLVTRTFRIISSFLNFVSEIRKVQDSTWKLCAACDSRCLSQGFWVVMVAAEKKKQKNKRVI